MGRNPIDSEVVARVYVDFSAIVTLLLGGALACYGLVLCLKMKKVRSERASSEMRKRAKIHSKNMNKMNVLCNSDPAKQISGKHLGPVVAWPAAVGPIDFLGKNSQ
ncbi:LOW QUALITY PROTEIN: hypothetical protein CsSME_00014431 [Camellia sinensis var. sinensis]